MKLNPKTIKYGLIVVDPTQKDDILHFVGYWDKPTKQDIDSLREELMKDEEFGLTEIANRLDILYCPEHLLKKYISEIS